MDKANHDLHHVITPALFFRSNRLAIPVPTIPEFTSNHEASDMREQASKPPAMSNEAPTDISKKIQDNSKRLTQSTDLVVNLYPDTFRQDLMYLGSKRAALLAQRGRVLADSLASDEEDIFVYRTNLGRLDANESQQAAIHGRYAFDGIPGAFGSEVHSPGNTLDERPDLNHWFGDDLDPAKAARLADRVRHLEILIPMEPSTMIDVEAHDDHHAAANKTAYLFARLVRAFPNVRSLVTRIATYQIGQKMSYVRESPSSKHYAAMELPERLSDHVTLDFQRRITDVVRAVICTSAPALRKKAIVLFQEKERDHRRWWDGTLGDPGLHIDHRKLQPEDAESVAKQMMAHSCCSVQL
ncbi:hypothetical protein KC363_g1565 [Hortaea werneckii]|nr:hypothetical protein KC361_g3047 [Hortaea werneckii]KAI6886118.1 hypothetical protein KC325_g3081 [Hortaea werneckii]KAI6995807.1 hypothetical protein KC359_g3898 [Hortaea werneckii]KAI7147498.1 hypothetical protein KC344_g2798 [Hortaea werneckii]KAI7176219.1 hypothetical protein KC360_g3172 [Hortaea werneckii]